MKQIITKVSPRLIEAIALFVGLVAVLYFLPLSEVLIPILWIVALFSLLYLKIKPIKQYKKLTKPVVIYIVTRWSICSILLFAAAYLIVPLRFLQLPLEAPLLWSAIMIFYPLFSVLPQSIVFRQLWFTRYAQIFTTQKAKIVAAGMLFGFMHILLHNPIAPVLTAAGGLLFAQTHYKYGLAAGTLEHALYGMVIFTSGLGWFFYGGAI